MTYIEFFRRLENGSIPPVCLFTGPDSYGKRQAMNALCAALLPAGLESLNYAILEDATAEKILDAAETLPVMCNRRLVEVRDWAPLFGGKSKNEEAEVERFQAYLKAPAESCVLVMNTRTEPDGKKKLSKLLNEYKIEFLMPTDAELLKWAGAICQAQGVSISRSAMDKLIFAAGRDRTRLSGELEKLCAFAGQGNEIAPEHVDAIVAPSLEYSIFQLMDMLLSKRLPQALAALETLITAGESRIGILAMLARQLRNLAHVRFAMDENHLAETQEQLGLKAYPAKIVAQQAKLYPAKTFQKLYEACVQADFDIKSGLLREKEALNALIFEIYQNFF